MNDARLPYTFYILHVHIQTW